MWIQSIDKDGDYVEKCDFSSLRAKHNYIFISGIYFFFFTTRPSTYLSLSDTVSNGPYLLCDL